MNNDSEAFSGKYVIVTGAAGGIGSEISRAFSHAGAQLALIDSNEEGLRKVALAIGGNPLLIQVDLGSPQEIEKAISKLIDHHKSWDILVNNAAVVKRGPLLDFSVEDWDTVLQVNLRSIFLLSRGIAKHMIDHGGGKIINISSNATYYGTPGSGPYAVSKAGLNQLTRTMAIEWGQYNIQANAICPSVVMTELGRRIWDAPENKSLKEKMVARIPLGRLAELEEIIPLVLFLAGPGSNYINGEVIGIDDGARFNPF